MFRKLLFFLLLLISLPTCAKIGANSNFWLLSQTEYNLKISKGQNVVLRRYLIVPDLDENYKDIFKTTDEKALLAKFSFLLKKNKIKLIEKYLNYCNNKLEINNLIKALYYFSENQYETAISYLEKFENEEYSFLKAVLIADCNYELLQDKSNYKSIIGFYQKAMDSTEDEQNKSMIDNRIKFIKYY